jgi:uncharacterized membrane protein YkoI
MEGLQMKTIHTAVFCLATMALSACLAAQDNEKKIKRSDLPQAVEKAVEDQSKGATIRGFSQETENGKVAYEAQLLVEGHTKDILMDETGTVLEIEEQVTMDDLSPAVKEGLSARANGRSIKKVESLTKKGSIVAYEAQVVKGSKKSEIQVGPDGNALDHEE